MASRLFDDNCLHLESSVVELYFKITIGSTGAPTITRGKGLTSIARSAAGKYNLVLQDGYQEYLGCTFVLTDATAMQFDFQFTASAPTAGTLSIGFSTNGTFAELHQGAILDLCLKCRNSIE
jgi:hypothetical protein